MRNVLLSAFMLFLVNMPCVADEKGEMGINESLQNMQSQMQNIVDKTLTMFDKNHYLIGQWKINPVYEKDSLPILIEFISSYKVYIDEQECTWKEIYDYNDKMLSYHSHKYNAINKNISVLEVTCKGMVPFHVITDEKLSIFAVDFAKYEKRRFDDHRPSLSNVVTGYWDSLRSIFSDIDHIVNERYLECLKEYKLSSSWNTYEEEYKACPNQIVEMCKTNTTNSICSKRVLIGYSKELSEPEKTKQLENDKPLKKWGTK